MSAVFYRLFQCGALSDGFLQGFHGYLLLFLLSQHRDTKFSLQISLTCETLIFQHKKRNFVSPSGHVMFDLFCKHHWNAKPLTFFFGVKGMFYNETIATMIFSHYEDKSHVIWLTRHAKNSNSLTGVSHNFSQACSSSFGDCHLKIPVIGLFHWILYSK